MLVRLLLGTTKCPEPLRTFQVLPVTSWHLAPRQRALPHLPHYYRLMRQSSTLPPPRFHPCTAGLCRLRSAPAGMRTFPTLLCESFPTCLDPYPGGSCGAITRFFPQDNGLPDVRTRSALSFTHTAISVWTLLEAAVIHSCSGPQVCSPPRSLLPQCLSTRQPWLLHPSLSRFVTSPCPGYANRSFRATDGKGTFTPQDSQPCRLLP